MHMTSTLTNQVHDCTCTSTQYGIIEIKSRIIILHNIILNKINFNDNWYFIIIIVIIQFKSIMIKSYGSDQFNFLSYKPMI